MAELTPGARAWRDEGRFVKVNGREIFVVEQGAGERTILICHGFPGSTYDWRGVIPALAARARVVSFDLLGYGLSDKPMDARYSLFEQADLAEAIARVLGVERCVLVGHDVGDTVVAELLKRATEGALGFEVEQAILTNGSIFIDLVQLSPGQQALLMLPDEPLADSLPLEHFLPGLAATFSEEHMPGDDELQDMLALIRHNDGDRLLPRIIRYIEERRRNQDRWTAGLVDYPGPMTAIWGALDPIAVIAMPQRLAGIREGTELVVWDDVSHWPSIEVPERLASAILDRI